MSVNVNLQNLASAKWNEHGAEISGNPFGVVTVSDGRGSEVKLFFAGAGKAQAVSDAINAAIGGEG